MTIGTASVTTGADSGLDIDGVLAALALSQSARHAEESDRLGGLTQLQMNVGFVFDFEEGGCQYDVHVSIRASESDAAYSPYSAAVV